MSLASFQLLQSAILMRKTFTQLAHDFRSIVTPATLGCYPLFVFRLQSVADIRTGFTSTMLGGLLHLRTSRQPSSAVPPVLRRICDYWNRMLRSCDYPLYRRLANAHPVSLPHAPPPYSPPEVCGTHRPKLLLSINR